MLKSDFSSNGGLSNKWSNENGKQSQLHTGLKIVTELDLTRSKIMNTNI